MLIDETLTRNGDRVYRFYTRNSNNSCARLHHLNAIRLAIEKELSHKGILKERAKHDKEKRLRRLEHYKAKSREYYHLHRDEINTKRRAKRAQLKIV